VSDDLRDAAARLTDRWFDRLWSTHRWEIEVAPARRFRGLRVQDGLRLDAPFGLGDDRRVWWVPVRERRLPGGAWRALRAPTDAEHELDQVLQEAHDRAV